MTRSPLRDATPTALFAHAVGYALAAVVAFVNAPRASELSTDPAAAIARGLVPEGLITWVTRAGASFAIGTCALVVATSLFGSLSRIAITRAAVYGDTTTAAYVHALRVFLPTLLARLLLLVATAVLVVIASLPLVAIAMTWHHPHDARLHDLTVLGLGALPLGALFTGAILDDLLHVGVVLHGPRPLEALVLGLRVLHRRAVFAALCAALFTLGVRLIVAHAAITLAHGAAVTALAFSLLGCVALVRAALLVHYAAETQRHIRRTLRFV